MAKIADAMDKVAKTVVAGYKKIETGVVTGFNNVNDAIIGTVFSKEGETVAQTRERLSGKKPNP